MEFSSTALLFIALIFLFAAFVHGSIGFGFPLLTTSLLALITDIQSAILMTLIPTMLVNLVSIASEGNFVEALHRHLSLTLLAICGTAAGTLILIAFPDSELFKLLLALAILVYLIADKVKLRIHWIRVYPRSAKIIFGSVAGMLGGLTNVMAPVLIIYSLESGHSKKDLIQAANFCFLSGKITQIFLFSFFGNYTVRDLPMSSVLLGVVAIALYAGVHVKKKIEGDNYIRILKVFLFILALMLIARVTLW